MQRAERDLGGDAEPEHQQDDRIEGDLRDRVERREDRLADLSGQAIGAEDKPQRQSADERDDAATGKGKPGRPDMGPELRAREVFARSPQGGARR